jgi:hypothetical protein
MLMRRSNWKKVAAFIPSIALRKMERYFLRSSDAAIHRSNVLAQERKLLVHKCIGTSGRRSRPLRLRILGDCSRDSKRTNCTESNNKTQKALHVIPFLAGNSSPLHGFVGESSLVSDRPGGSCNPSANVCWLSAANR